MCYGLQLKILRIEAIFCFELLVIAEFWDCNGPHEQIKKK